MRPGSPLIYRIPATGDRPLAVSAEGLPAGLTLDPHTGILTGRVTKAGAYRVTLGAANALGRASRVLRLVVGDRLALTPPMGWNSWYIHYDRVSDKILRQAADQMIASGMADYGYQYVNSDDCWDVKPGSRDPEIGGPARDASGRLLPNRRFPDMKALTAYIHAKGLKAGIYISPGPTTCGGYEGSYGHEALDARTLADWGFDFLKYDWCSYGSVAKGKGLEYFEKPYQKMWGELQKLDRDLVFNLCQYGMGEVWKWGGEVGNCWRTTGDLGVEGPAAGLPGFYRIGLSNAQHWQYARPGAWNDPDYILVGWVGDAQQHGQGHAQPAHARRAILLHVALVPDGLAVDLLRRHGKARSLHPQRALQPRADRCRPGPAGQAGPHRPADRRRAGVVQADGRRLDSGGPVQPRSQGGEAFCLLA